MKDAPEMTSPHMSQGSSSRPGSSAGTPQDNTKQGPHPQPPVPPWSHSSAPGAPDSSLPVRGHGLHVELPPPSFLSQPPATPVSATSGSSTGSMLGNQIAQSPSTTMHPPLFSPAITGVVAPSPTKKKLSLSDYTSRKAKQNSESQAAASSVAGAALTNTSPNASSKQSQLQPPSAPIQNHPSPLRTLSQPPAVPDATEETTAEVKTESPPLNRADGDWPNAT